MTTEDDFQRQLDEHPEDHHARLVFADWLQERGDPRAEGYRALGALDRIPSFVSASNPDYGMLVTLPGLCMVGADDNPTYAFNTDPTYSRCLLHRDWFDLVGCERIEENELVLNPGTFWKCFRTRREAEDAAALAFSKLPPERRAAFGSEPVRGGSAPGGRPRT